MLIKIDESRQKLIIQNLFQVKNTEKFTDLFMKNLLSMFRTPYGPIRLNFEFSSSYYCSRKLNLVQEKKNQIIMMVARLAQLA